MNNSSSLHNDLLIWAMVVEGVGQETRFPTFFPQCCGFALRLVGLFLISPSDGVIGFRFTSFNVAPCFSTS